MQKYILQVASTGEVEWDKRYDTSDKNQLNKEHSYCELQPDEIALDLIDLIEEHPKLNKEYKNKKQQINNKYKVLLIGVGPHDKGEICLHDEKGNKAAEIAHIDKEPFTGKQRMNRLYVFDEEPKQIIFYNKKLDRKYCDSITFQDKCAKINIDFDD